MKKKCSKKNLRCWVGKTKVKKKKYVACACKKTKKVKKRKCPPGKVRNTKLGKCVKSIRTIQKERKSKMLRQFKRKAKVYRKARGSNLE